MHIYELLKERESKKVYIKNKDEAFTYFAQQKSNLEWIAKTSWFREIRDYRYRVVVWCNERLRTIKSEDIKRIQWELDVAMQFLDFLDNILQREDDSEDLDILQP
jgi:hypothetical protein